MKLGNSIYFILFFFLMISNNFSEDRIITSPLINLNKIKPSFEDIEEKNEKEVKKNLKKKKKESINLDTAHAVLIGLDKITAKSSKIIVNIDETKKFGPLEIKILKCKKTEVHNEITNVAYMQVKDLTKNENEKVFIFNGWTFSSDPSLTPFDHAIYDLQLLNCFNV